MRAQFLVDYNPRLRKGDDVPADLVRKMVRCGLAKIIPEPGQPEFVDEVPLEKRLKADLITKAQELGLPVEEQDTKAILIARIREAEAA